MMRLSVLHLAKVVCLKEVTKFAYCGLIRYWFSAKVYANKVAHGAGIIKGFFYCRIGKVEPVLQKVNTKHTLYSYRRTPCSFGLWIKGLYDVAELFPGNDLSISARKRYLRVGLR